MVDLGIVEAILVSGLGGLGVRVVVSMLKDFLRLNNKLLMLALTLVVCGVAVAIYLIPVGFAWGLFATYTAFVFMASQGWYRATHSS